MSRTFSIALAISFSILSSGLRAADWPMWRCDAARSNSSTANLPDDLQLNWVRQLPHPIPAWPASQPKLQFDAVIQPIVIGESVIVSSTAEDTVTAYSTDTGEMQWQFFTAGPVRFAPAAHSGRVFVGSDDGYLYCLDAATGKLYWKVNGGPTDRHIIGNNRLVSTWPARGGPVVADGVVYFTASIWPFMGIFIHAVDAESGEILWTNSETGSSWITHPHGAPSFGSVVPQGYLAVSGDRLIVPGGRSSPAVFDRHTGKLLHFQFGGKGAGGWNVCANKQIYVVQREALELAGGKSVGSFAADVLTDDLLIQSNAAHLLSNTFKESEGKDRRGNKIKRLQMTPTKSWQIGNGDFSVVTKIGSNIYAGGKGRVACFEFEIGKSHESSWSAEVGGNVASILAGDDKLFVVMDDAKLHCFGVGKDQVRIHKIAHLGIELNSEQITEETKRILQFARDSRGYVVVDGITNDPLIDALIETTHCRVIVLDADQELVGRFQRRMQRLSYYGHRVTAHVGDVESFRMPPYLAHAIIVAKKRVELSSATVDAIFQSLRPYGGRAWIASTDGEHQNLVASFKQMESKGGVVGRQDAFTTIERAGPLPGSSNWTHQYGDAANSVVSKDQLVKAPLGLLWFGGPPNDKVLPRHGHGPSPQVAGGRLVIEGPDMLRAVDVYTGHVLWERELPGLGAYYNITGHFPGAGEIGSNYVTLPDAVYAVYGRSILQLAPASGETRRQYDLEADDNNPQPFWGFIAAEGDYLVATSSPVTVGISSGDSSPKSQVPKDMTPLVDRGATWQYLAVSDPAENWTSVDFKPGGDWKVGKAGFGYGDGDDRTKLNMKGQYQRVYIRRTIEAKNAVQAKRMMLSINYDDAFIAYLNGKEVLRVGVGQGSGAKASRIASHEASGFESFEIKDFAKLLRPGDNVLAIEGHNTNLTSSDFTLDPFILIGTKGKSGAKPPEPDKDNALVKLLSPTQYSSASRQLVVFDRRSGKRLWSRSAELNFRHNCIVVAGERLFCIDSMSPSKLQALQRRGLQPEGKSRLLALNVRTGEEIWSTTEDVFGTFLNYSTEHDILLQAGSAYRDRARDEVGTGMVAYRGSDGSVVWKDLSKSHNGPCLLWRDKIITNGAGGHQLDLLTGEETGWSYRRMYGCNTAVGSEHLLTFRSGAAGFCDLAGDSGTGNVGGFRSSCTANLIVADGVLNAPDYTRTCSCAYQNQSSLAMIHMPEAEVWTFSSTGSLPRQFGVNLGAPGDRRGPDGLMWYDTPSIGGTSPGLPVEISGSNLRYVRHHSSLVESDSKDNRNWVASSAAIGVTRIVHELPKSEAKQHRVRLYFAELEKVEAGERVFDVSINGKTVAEDLDVVRIAGAPRKMFVREIEGVMADDLIEIQLAAKRGSPSLSGYVILPD